ncbi:unnamed protein product [Mytilus coruscus]|uniref:Reverse transcriptase domain-containing protein n=1 Tax=Mytilus coruscus TaxID=42192 RepID=A0A6J8C3L0_MYTCO|nr:unnamed protein product [Mytilus coruscus]
MEDVLRGLQWEKCLSYMNDITVPGATFEEELLRLEHVFQRMREANLKLKPSKCILFQKSVKFLGHVDSEHGVQTDPEKIEANFHPYVYGRPVLLRTDNAAVSWLQSLKDPTGQVARWLQTLGTYNFKVTHRAGRKHTNADAMSRNPSENLDAREVSDHPVECRSNLEKQKETVEHLATPLTEADETPDIKNTEITGLIPGMIRAETRSELKEQQNEMKDNEALLGGWEPSEIRQQQLEDENIGKVFAAFEHVEAGSQKPP